MTPSTEPSLSCWPDLSPAVPASAAHPLVGVRVLDLSELLPGPVATQALADLGADVIKVERAGDGDPMRVLMPQAFGAVNRNKRSVALDLKNPDDQLIAKSLASQADVFVEGFRPGVVDRLGCDYATLSADNPALVYCSISGFGQHSARRSDPGHDINYMGLAGAIRMDIDSVEPSSLIPAADMLAASQATTSICAALFAARNTGRGCLIDVSMTDCVVAATAHLLNEHNANPSATATFARHPAYGIFVASDGRPLAVGCTETHFFQRLCEVLQLQHLLDDETLLDYGERKTRWEDIAEQLQRVIRTGTRRHWLDTLAAAGLPATAVHDPRDVMTDPDFIARGLVSELDGTVHVPFPVLFDNNRPGLRTAAPLLGSLNLAGPGRSAESQISA